MEIKLVGTGLCSVISNITHIQGWQGVKAHIY